MTYKVLEGGNDPRLVRKRSVTLKAAHRRNAEARNQVRIFAVSFFDTTPARIARHIDDRRQRLVRAADPRLSSRNSKKSFYQFRVESCRQPNRLWKTSGVNCCVTVQTFFMKHYRDAEAA